MRFPARAWVVVATFVLVSFPGAVPAAGEPSPVRFLVELREDPGALSEGERLHGADVVLVNGVLDFVAVETTDPEGFLARARSDPRVADVREDPIRPMLLGDFAPAFVPNDPSFGSQYGPQQIRADDAWNVTLGTVAAKVCVVDTGVRYTHEDLAGARWLGGHDFVNGDADPMDDHGHGTHVAGTAAGTIQNAIGIAGVGNVGVYGVKVLNSGGSGSLSALATAITWCADNAGPRTVISMSLGCFCFEQAVVNAINYAHTTKGLLVVAAAGNSGPCSNCVIFPASASNVMAVTCTTATEQLCSFSSTGPQASVAAPGNAILSTYHTANNAYATMSGTSMSTPHVSGAAALYWSHDAAITNSQLRSRIEATAGDRGTAGFDHSFGHGRVDVLCLFEGPGCVVPAPPPPPPPPPGPTNDLFANGLALQGAPVSDTRSTVGATMESGEPAPCGAIGSTVWYNWTAPGTGTVTIETTGSNYDTVLAAYTGSSLTGLTNRACNDDYSGLLSRISFAVTGGTTYRIQAGGYASATGTLTVVLSLAVTCPAPENNAFACATTVPAIPYSTTQGTSGATLESGEPVPCGSFGATVWYRWTPSTSGIVVASTAGSTFDTVLAAYTGSALPSLSLVACNDDSGAPAGPSSISFSATAGTTYRFQVGGTGGATGSLSFFLATGVPSAPLDLVATGAANAISLEWSPPASDGGDPVTEFRIHRAAGSCAGAFTHHATVPAFATDWNETGLPDGTTYCYKVGAVNSRGAGPTSAPAAATTFGPPGAPVGVVATPGPAAGELRVAWSAAPPNGFAVTAYRVGRATSCGVAFDEIGVLGPEARSFADAGLGNGVTRCYRVTAENERGAGPASAGSSATTFTVSAAPRNLAASGGPSQGQIRSTWLAPLADGGTPVVAYHVSAAASCAGPFAVLATLDAATFAHVESGLGDGTSRCYVVAAENLVGVGPASIPASATTWTVPAAPASVGVVPGPGIGQLKLDWTAPPSDGGTALTGYAVSSAATCAGPFAPLAITAPGVRTFTDSNLGPGTLRCYLVAATNAIGAGPTAGPVSARTFDRPGAPTAPSALPGPGAGQITVEWGVPASTGGTPISQYSVYVATSAGGPWSLLGTTSASARSLLHSGLAKATWRWYQVTAWNADGEGTPSAVVSARTFNVASAPTGVVARPGILPGEIRVDWQAPSDDGGTPVASYDVYRSRSEGGPYTRVAVVLAPQRTWTDGSTSPLLTYWYKVAATNMVGEGPQSSGACSWSGPSVLRC